MSKQRLCLWLVVLLLLGVVGGVVFKYKPKPPDDDAVTTLLHDDLSEVHQRWHRQWDEERDTHPAGPARDQARWEWRKGYHAELRAVYERHGKDVPAYLKETKP